MHAYLQFPVHFEEFKGAHSKHHVILALVFFSSVDSDIFFEISRGKKSCNLKFLAASQPNYTPYRQFFFSDFVQNSLGTIHLRRRQI